MAIDNAQPTVQSSRHEDGTRASRVITKRTGVDNGNDFTAGDIVREISDATTKNVEELRLATASEISAYLSETARQVTVDTLDSAQRTLKGNQTVANLYAYLQAKHPGDFA